MSAAVLVRRAVATALLTSLAAPALAAPDTVYLSHQAGPCSNYKFPTIHVLWNDLGRVDLASGETIHVTLYGHGADLASDATGSDIREWIAGRGTTTDYPNAPVMFGSKVAKGYLTVAIKADPSDGTGNRNVTVRWPTGNETIPVRIVPTCEDISPRIRRGPPPAGSGGGSGTGTVIAPPRVIGGGSGAPALFVDVAPRANLLNIFRRIGGPVAINNGSFLQVDDRWCAGLAIPARGSATRTITLPDLTWGVSNVGTAAVPAPFAAQLSAGSAILQTQTVAPAALAVGATQDFGFARARSTVRVIRFAPPAPQGCFVNPNDPDFFEDPPLTVRVDTAGALAEANEANNDRSY